MPAKLPPTAKPPAKPVLTTPTDPKTTTGAIAKMQPARSVYDTHPPLLITSIGGVTYVGPTVEIHCQVSLRLSKHYNSAEFEAGCTFHTPVAEAEVARQKVTAKLNAALRADMDKVITLLHDAAQMTGQA